MAISKVVYGDETLVDLTSDTVSSDNVLSGVTFHSANGEEGTGSVVVADVIDNLTSESTTDALSANQGRVLNEKFDDLDDVYVKASSGSETSVVDIVSSPFRFGIDTDGNYGYYKVGETTLTPFGSGGN